MPIGVKIMINLMKNIIGYLSQNKQLIVCVLLWICVIFVIYLKIDKEKRSVFCLVVENVGNFQGIKMALQFHALLFKFKVLAGTRERKILII